MCHQAWLFYELAMPAVLVPLRIPVCIPREISRCAGRCLAVLQDALCKEDLGEVAVVVDVPDLVGLTFRMSTPACYTCTATAVV